MRLDATGVISVGSCNSDKCYANHSERNQELKAEITVTITAIRPEKIENVLKNCVDRMD